MCRYQQSILFSIILVGLIYVAAACGVRETGSRPDIITSTSATIMPSGNVYIHNATDQVEIFRQETLTIVSEYQTMGAIKIAIMTEESDARLKGQVLPTWNAERETIIGGLADVEHTRIARYPTSTPYVLNATPFVGPGKLIEHPQAPFGSIEFVGKNSWNYKVGEQSITVYAGRQGRGVENDQDFNQGMVEVVDWTTGVPKSVSSNKTPVSDGPAWIVDAQVEGEQLYLTIVTEGGSRYRFHVNSGEFTPLP